MRLSTQDNVSPGANLGFKSLIGLEYAKKNPRLAKTVLGMKSSKAFEKLFSDPRFDCFVRLSSTKMRYSHNWYESSTYTVPAEKCEIDIVSKNGKSNFINNLRAWFDNSCKRYLEKETPSLTAFVNKFDERNIGTILIQKDSLPERLLELGDDELVKMANDMIAQREELLSTSVQNEQYVKEASKAAEETLKKNK